MAMESPWIKLFNAGDDASLIAVTGFDYRGFTHILREFQGLYDTQTPHTQDGMIHRINSPSGRKRLMDAKDCLGMYLLWSRSKMTNVHLDLIFGMTATSCFAYLKFACRLVIHVTNNDPLARIHLPTGGEVVKFQRAIS